MAPPPMLNLRVIIGLPGTDQGSEPPLIRNVPGPVPFTISADWVGARDGGTFELAITATYDDGAPVQLLDGGRWTTRFVYSRNFTDERFAHEDLTVLALIERGGVLHFRRRVGGELVGQAAWPQRRCVAISSRVLQQRVRRRQNIAHGISGHLPSAGFSRPRVKPEAWGFGVGDSGAALHAGTLTLQRRYFGAFA